MIKLVTFSASLALGGIGYLWKYQNDLVQSQLDNIMAQGKLKSFLYDFHQDSAYSIDLVMDQYEHAYNRTRIQEYRKTLVGLAKDKVLQTCMGSNRNILYYRPTVQLTLLDYSPNMHSVAKTKFNPFVTPKYIVGDVTCMQLPSDSFDYVVDTFGLEYVAEPSKALEEIRRVCKKDGIIILMNQGLTNVWGFQALKNFGWQKILLSDGYFSNRNWKKLIQQFDFQIQHSQMKKNGNLQIFILKNVKDGNYNKYKIQPKQKLAPFAFLDFMFKSK